MKLYNFVGQLNPKMLEYKKYKSTFFLQSQSIKIFPISVSFIMFSRIKRFKFLFRLRWLSIRGIFRADLPITAFKSFLRFGIIPLFDCRLVESSVKEVMMLELTG